jgi:prepilin-type N-terminal cleavage/methylation domain-containing protein
MRIRTAFTLIELLLVIIILSVIVGLSATNFSNSFTNIELKKSAENIAYLVRWAQARAVHENATYQLLFLENSRNYRILRGRSSEDGSQESFEPVPVHMGRVFSLPASVQVERPVGMKIYPDGTLDKMRIRLIGRKDKALLSTMEQRGNIFILEDEDEP